MKDKETAMNPIQTDRNAMMISLSELTHQDLVARWIDFAQVSKHTERAYLKGAMAFFQFCAAQGVAAPTRSDVLAWLKAMERDGLSVSTRHLRLVAIRRLFCFLEDEGLARDVTRGVKVPKADAGHKRGAMDGAAIALTIRKAGGASELERLRNRAMIALMATSALRVCEVARADVQDLDAVNGVLYVHGKARHEKGELDSVKVQPQVLAMLEEYARARGAVAADAPLFASCSDRNKGGRLTSASVSMVAKAAMKAAGYDSKRLTAHSLRHSAITLAYLADAPAAKLQEFARHQSFDTTRLYIHEAERSRNACGSLVAAAIFGKEVE